MRPAERRLPKLVGAVLAGCGAAPDPARTELLARLPVTELIEAALAAPADQLAQLAGDSYQHANGFAKLSFPAVPGSTARLRLHIWKPTTTADSDAHNHRWSFASRILYGRLHQQVYSCEPSATGSYAHYRHAQTSPRRGYRLSLIGRAAGEVTGHDVYSADDVYHLPHRTIHRVWADPLVGAATVVVEHPPVTTVTDVFCPDAKAVDIELDPPRFTPAHARALLADLLRELRHG